MKKIYSYVLMVTALLIGTNVWAEDGVIEIVRGGVTQATTYDHLGDAFAAAQDGDILQLTNNMTENQSTAAWFGQTTSGTLENYASTDRSITLDLKGHTYAFTGAALSKIVLTRGVLRIKSTGGKGEITSDKNVISVYGTYLKIDAKKDTPFSHLIVEENVKISSGTDDQYLAVVLDSPLRPYYVTNSWKWDHYPFDYACNIYGFIDDNAGVSNGARVDIYGELSANKYAFQVTGNLRCSKEYVNIDGSSREAFKKGPYYHRSGNKTAYRPFTTINGKDSIKSGNGIWYYYDETNSANDDYVVAYTDDSLYSPYVHIHPTAKLTTKDPSNPKAVGFYSSGYARCYIEGLCEGSTGVYVKSGEIELHDATVVSNWTSEYKGAANDLSVSGVSAGGSAIVIESKAGWTGNIDVTISGDTHVSTDHGYAIDEKVTKGGETKVNYLTITGGTFEGGQIPVRDENGEVIGHKQGTMIVSEQTLAANNNPDTITTITILGAQMTVNEEEATADSVGNITLAEFLAGQSGTHITYVEVPDPNNPSVTKTTMVISEGSAPSEDPDNVGNTTWEYIASQSNSDNPPSYAWTAIEQNQQISSGTIYLGELQINSGSDGNLQELIINNGATLQVERLIMNSYARIIVKAGGKLIVKGTQGISAPNVANILLETSEADGQALFLIHPNVSSNRHPKATYRFTSKAFWNDPTWVYQRFAMPTYSDGATVEVHNPQANIGSWVARWDYVNDQWGAWEAFTENTWQLDKADPFRGYMLASDNAEGNNMIYDFKGNLVGNVDANLKFYYGWNYFANSYTAPINIKKILENALSSLNANNILATMYVYKNMGNNTYKWQSINKTSAGSQVLVGKDANDQPIFETLQTEVQPMQAFLMQLRTEGTTVNQALSYKYGVYNPAMNITEAPARAHNTNSKMQVAIYNATEVDNVMLVEDAQFSADLDNGHDAVKCEKNEGLKLYAMNQNERMEIVATDNVEGTFMGVDALTAGNYTLYIYGVNDMEYAIVDMQTGVATKVAEGAKYNFYTEAGRNDYRFQIVEASKVATDIENTEVKANVKGIYTITGLYLGENFDVLPAGVYVVNGVKVIK